MHNFIYQIFYDETPKEDWATDYCSIENPMLLPIAASVNTANDRKQAILQFGCLLERKQLGKLSFPSFTFSPMAAERYLSHRYEAFHKTAADLLDLSKAQFVQEYDTVDNLISQLKSHYCDFFDCYFMELYEPPVPFDIFLRIAPPNTPFYFGAVFDYCI